MKKADKALAKEWVEEQNKIAQDNKYLEDKQYELEYNVNKGNILPCEHTLRRLGYTELADKVSQAKDLMESICSGMEEIIAERKKNEN